MGSGLAWIYLALQLSNQIGDLQRRSNFHAQQGHYIILSQLQESCTIDLIATKRVTVCSAIVDPQKLGYIIDIPRIRHQFQLRFI